MKQHSQRYAETSVNGFYRVSSEMGERTRAFDWSQTPLGSQENWPQSLKIAVRIMLDSRYAMWLGWGPEFTFFYNDAYARMTLGPKHPWALGRPAREVWSEIWEDIGPRAESVVRTGEATWDEGLLLFLERRGFPEETYHTFSYSPIPDDAGGVGGMLCVVTEDTERTIGERRLQTLRELGARTSEQAKSAEEACQIAAQTLAENQRDLPFVLIYLLDADGQTARLAGAMGLPEGSSAAPRDVDVDGASGHNDGWPFGSALNSGRSVIVSELSKRFGLLPGGAWPEPPEKAVLLPIAKPGQTRLAGYVVAGLSPRLEFDDAYMGFLDLLTSQIASAVTNARAYEEERRRAESLAELDRAKTAFFSNVSHEFRTPLTLLLGLLDDVLADDAEPLSFKHRDRLQVAHRNSLRLQKLVNTLLDFSRLEAGRVRATYRPVDLASLTADIASNFRSACEKASVELRVDCRRLREPVYVDREMWEKIVLNLVSNAFKYTFEGCIEVTLREIGGRAILSVRDTGTGIPADQLPLLFERFHRVEGAAGRSQEGTGIGLALVKELVRLHGGEVRVESELGKGSTFTVTFPLGKSHLPADHIGTSSPPDSTARGTAPFVEEALQWLPGEKDEGEESEGERKADSSFNHQSSAVSGRPVILLADDNTDMRHYVARLLSAYYEVEEVTNGLDALAFAQNRLPDLIVSDVMMPGLDGFGLLKALRADPRTATVPFLLLSARADEEARLEGLQAGADDYMTKPFSAKELLARVQAHLALVRMRLEAGEALQRSEWFHRLISELTSDFTFSVVFEGDGISSRVDFVSPGFTNITGFTLEELNARGGWPTIIYADDIERVRQTVELMLTARQDESEVRLMAKDGTVKWVRYLTQPVVAGSGKVTGFIGAGQHISDRKIAELALREATTTLRSFYDTSPLMMGVVEVTDRDILHLTDNAAAGHFFGIKPEEISRRWASQLGIPAEHSEVWIKHYRESEWTGKPVRFEYPHQTAGGTRWVSAIVYCIERLSNGRSRCSYVAEDITERKRVEELVRNKSERLRLLWESATVMLTTEDPDAMLLQLFRRIAPHFGIDVYFNFLVNDTGDALRLGSCSGLPEEEVRKIGRLEFGQAVCGNVAQRREPIVATFIQQSEEPMVQLVKAYGIRAYACNPLMVEGGRLFGTLSFASRSRDHFDSEELEFLRTICHYVTVAYERLRLVHQLREQDRRKDEFLATLAHELRNPLAPIQNSLQILKMPRLDAEIVRRSREMMERQVHQLVRLVDDLLEVSRVMRGKIELRKEKVEFSTVIARAVEMVQPLIDAQDHKLTIDLASESLPLDADPMRLTQVIGNLLTNSAKYTEAKGRIHLTARREENQVVFRLADSGIGIAPDMLSRIFELFVQVDHAAKRSQGGLGIGLTLVRNLVEMHNGSVEARSEGIGKGSEFIVKLPLASPAMLEPSEPREIEERPTATLSGHRLLVVDDNRDAAESLAMLLDLQGYDVRVSHDGPSALEMAKDYKPELVFLDLGMPGMDGYEAAARLRQMPGLEKVRLAALTGWGQKEDRRRTSEAGFDHHLVKPVEQNALEGVLAVLFRKES